MSTYRSYGSTTRRTIFSIFNFIVLVGSAIGIISFSKAIFNDKLEDSNGMQCIANGDVWVEWLRVSLYLTIFSSIMNTLLATFSVNKPGEWDVILSKISIISNMSNIIVAVLLLIFIFGLTDISFTFGVVAKDTQVTDTVDNTGKRDVVVSTTGESVKDVVAETTPATSLLRKRENYVHTNVKDTICFAKFYKNQTKIIKGIVVIWLFLTITSLITTLISVWPMTEGQILLAQARDDALTAVKLTQSSLTRNM